MKLRDFGIKTSILLLPMMLINNQIYAAQCNTKQLDQIFNLMSQRNQLMEGVAAYKYVKKSNIYDAKQELIVLSDSLNIADTNQLNADKLMLFVQIQMDISKQIQQYWMEHWKIHQEDAPDPAITPDISSLRQQIAMIDAKLYPQIAAATANLKQCSSNITIKQYDKAMSNIKGIPQNPDYNLLVIAALRNISK